MSDELLNVLTYVCMLTGACFIIISVLMGLSLKIQDLWRYYYPSLDMMKRINTEMNLEIRMWEQEIMCFEELDHHVSFRHRLDLTMRNSNRVHTLARRVLWCKCNRAHPYYQSIQMMYNAHMKNCDTYIQALLDTYDQYLNRASYVS